MESILSEHLFRRPLNFALPQFHKGHWAESDPLLLLNEKLDGLRPLHEINEPVLEGLIKTLNGSNTSSQSLYWLTAGRIFELSLLCAGNYADNCEFSAAGDLLVNPRKILIHQKGCPNSLVKQRHGRLSDQLKKCEISGKHTLLSLKRKVLIEVAEPAILPYLFELLKHSRKISSWYLDEAQNRMKKIADTISFLSAWSVLNLEDFHKRIQKASLQTREFVKNNLCRFDTGYFERIGREIKRKLIGSNEFYIVGPKNDPADIANAASAAEAYANIAKTRAKFFSRGDNSGTHKKEMAIWQKASIQPAGDWYTVTNTFMMATLKQTNAQGGYFMTDSSTWVAAKKEMNNLKILFRGDPFLINTYHTPCQPEGATDGQPYASRFIDFVVSEQGQDLIRSYGEKDHGEGLYNDAAYAKQYDH